MSERNVDFSFELHDLIGTQAFICLTEAYGGRRLMIPGVRASSIEALGEVVGLEAAQKLSRRFGYGDLRVPLAKEFRARHYRAAGLSNGQIATHLGMTETGVNRLFARMADKPVKGSDRSQLDLFQPRSASR